MHCPEKTLLHNNQGYLTVQKGNNIVYADHFFLGQNVPDADSPGEIESYECAEIEVKLIRPLYIFKCGEFRGIKETLAYINVWGDDNETFFNYGFSKDKWKVLYASVTKRIPNAFSETIFKKHMVELLN